MELKFTIGLTIFIVFTCVFIGFITYQFEKHGYDLIFVPLNDGKFFMLPIEHRKKNDL